MTVQYSMSTLNLPHHGGFEGSVVSLLNDLSKAARAKTPPGQEPPWPVRNFIPYCGHN